jgi:alanine racemase
VLNTALQVRRWREAAPGRPCDVMLDTGINRLGLSAAEVRDGIVDGLVIDTLLSHLASADEDSALNERQRALFTELGNSVPARRRSLANSAAICLGRDYAFDLTRPGLALYGGIPEARGGRPYPASGASRGADRPAPPGRGGRGGRL